MTDSAATIESRKLPAPLPIQQCEIEVLAPRARLLMDAWAEEYFVLSELTSEISGPYSLEYTPFLRKPMRRLSQVGPVLVTIIGCSQFGKSTLGAIFLGYTNDEAPGPFMVVMPRETDAVTRVNTRFRPMYQVSERMRKHLPAGRIENINIGRETILDNMILYIAWANSPAALADKPVCNIHFDEVSKYPPSTGKEADAVSLGKKRARTFRSRSKILTTTTPVSKGDLGDQEWGKSDQAEWWVQCPHCEDWHIISFWNVQIDKNAEGHLLAAEEYKNAEHARYVCPDCGTVWTDEDRWPAVSAGKWIPAGQEIDGNGQVTGRRKKTNHYGFHVHCMMLHPMFMDIGELASDWAAAIKEKKPGNIKPLQDFYNSQLAEPWAEAQKQTDEAKLLSHKGTYRRGFIPRFVQLITGAVDVQKDHFYVLSVGWGYLYQAAVIHYDRLDTGDTTVLKNWEPVEEFLKMTFPMAEDPDDFAVHSAVAVDCGYNTEVAYNFCRKNSWATLLPVMGDPHVRVRMSKKSPVTGSTLIRYDLNVDAIKNTIHQILHEQTKPGPGYIYLPADSDFELLRQLSSEEQVIVRERGQVRYVWVTKTHRANHWWDDLVYAKFAADHIGVRMLRDPKAARKKRKLSEIQKARRGD